MKMCDEPYTIIHLGNPYDFVIKNINGHETYGTFQGDKESMEEFIEKVNSIIKENDELKASNEGLLKDLNYGFKLIKSVEKENQQLIKMLDNVANYIQREHREMPLDDFVEWWNNIATDGLDGDNGVNGNKIRKRKVKADGRVDYVGISKEDLE